MPVATSSTLEKKLRESLNSIFTEMIPDDQETVDSYVDYSFETLKPLFDEATAEVAKLKAELAKLKSAKPKQTQASGEADETKGSKGKPKRAPNNYAIFNKIMSAYDKVVDQIGDIEVVITPAFGKPDSASAKLWDSHLEADGGVYHHDGQPLIEGMTMKFSELHDSIVSVLTDRMKYIAVLWALLPVETRTQIIGVTLP